MNAFRNCGTILLALVSAMVTGLPGPSAAEEAGYGATPNSLSFRARIEATAPFLEPISGSAAQRLRLFGGIAQWDYTFRRSMSEIAISFDRASVLGIVDGEEVQNVEMNQERQRERSDGWWVEVTNPSRLRMLQDSFGTPLYRITVDDHGKEIGRQILARSGADPMLKSGVIENARLFHAPFYSDRANWKAPTLLPMGPSRAARGEIRYEIVASDPDGPANLVRVSVSGTARKEMNEGKPEDEAEYRISGEQTYDTRLREWVSGRWRIALTFDAYDGKKSIGSDTAAMTVTMTFLGSKSAGP